MRTTSDMNTALTFGSLCLLAGTFLFGHAAEGQLIPIYPPSPQPGARFGSSVAVVFDVEFDGPDLIIGAPGETVLAQTTAGAVYLGSDRLFAPDARAGDEFGSSVAAFGDLNGDFVPDLAIGAPQADTAPFSGDGKVYLFTQRGFFGNPLHVQTLLSPTRETAGQFGYCLAYDQGAGTGNFNGVLLVGAPGESPGASPIAAGRVHVYTAIANAASFQGTLASPNEVPAGRFGTAVAVIPDATGDGVEDLLIGAPGETVGALTRAGRAYLFSGANRFLVRMFVSPSPETQGEFGSAVASAGDVNGDGLADVLIGAPLEDPFTSPVDCGRAYIFRSSTSALHAALSRPTESTNERFGAAVAGGLDLSGSGSAHVAVGTAAGRLYLYGAGSGAYISTIDSPLGEPDGGFGAQLAMVPGFDLQSDGGARLLVGARLEETPGGPPNVGVAYVLGNPTRRYVRAGATGSATGLQWPDAYPTLTQALDAIQQNPGAITEVWVAGGTYTRTAGSRGAAFEIPPGVHFYGGFDGSETALDQRDPDANLTIISGDSARNDQGDLNRSDNLYHVLIAVEFSDGALLDGFTVRAGNANGPGMDGLGGGLSAFNSDVLFRNCRFEDNVSAFGGGASFLLSASSGFVPAPRFEGCTFQRNRSGSGGAVHAAFNVAEPGGLPSFRSCEFTDNSATQGGALATSGLGGVLAYGCVFNGNSATTAGGAILLGAQRAGDALENCAFFGNVADVGGGAVDSAGGVGTAGLCISNCLFSGNRSTHGIGALNMRWTPGDSAPLDVRGSTFAFNSGELCGGIAWSGCETCGQTDIANTILWGNDAGGSLDGAAQIDLGSGTPYTITACCIQRAPAGLAGTFIQSDPRFADPAGRFGIPGTIDDNFRLMLTSPCLDTGDNALIGPDCADADGDGNFTEQAPFDLNGTCRIGYLGGPCGTRPPAPAPGPIVDIGAYEHPRGSAGTLWNGANGASMANSSSWTDGVPVSTTPAIFAGRPSSSATLDVPLSCARLVAGEGTTVLSGSGSLAATSGIAVGPWTCSPATLRISGLTISGLRLEIGPSVPCADQTITERSSLRLTTASTLQVTALRVTEGDLVLEGVSVEAEPGGITIGAKGRMAGTGAVNGPIISQGTLEPGLGPNAEGQHDFGIIETQDSIELARSAHLLIEIGGPEAEVPQAFDQVNAGDLVGLAGALTVSLVDGFVPEPGEQYHIINAASVWGQFDVAFLPGLPGNRYFRLAYPAPVRGDQGAVVLEQGELPGLVQLNPPESYGVTGVVRDAAVGDLNRDGFPDVALAVQNISDPLSGPGSLIVLFNGGNTSAEWNGFTSSTAFTIGVNPSAIAIGDFDGVDGNDLAVASEADDSVQAYFQQQLAGSFAAEAPFAVGDRPTDLFAGDLDRDGLADLAVTCAGDRTLLIFLRSAGTRGIDEFVLIAEEETEDEPADVRPFDPDGDKDADLAVVNQNSGTVKVFRNGLDTGTAFDEQVTIAVGNFPSGAAGGDLGRDDRADLVVVNGADGTVSVIINQMATAESPLAFGEQAVSFIGEDPAAITLVDLENDGDLDLAAVAKDTDSPDSAVLKLVRNDTDRTTTDGRVTLAAPATVDGGDNLFDVQTADLNNDGNDDLVTISGEPIGGGARSAGGGSAIVRAILNSSVSPCPCDLSGDGLDSQDYFEFLDLFFAGSPVADTDHNGQTESQDFFGFLECFFDGCE